MDLREYEIWRIVDVNMYNTLLSPEVTLDDDLLDDAERAAREALWNRFDFKKYSDFVCERAVIELKKLLKRLPSGMRVRYVEGSAEIYSPPYYNYGGDELIFRIKARSHRSQKSMQRYEEYDACPYCFGTNIHPARTCDVCGKWLTGGYIKTLDGQRICDDCYTTHDIEDD